MIKLFEQFTSEQEVDKICREYGLVNYSINSDLSVDVDYDYTLYNNGLSYKIPPIKFNKIIGSFALSQFDLESLQNHPRYVGGYSN
jgi:hypothetical protein